MSVGTMKKIKFFSAVGAFIIGISLLIMIVFTGANNSDRCAGAIWVSIPFSLL